MKRAFLSILSLAAAVLIAARLTDAAQLVTSTDEWPEYLGGPDRNHYSTLSQINTQNVSQLKVAWEYHTGDAGQMQCSEQTMRGSGLWRQQTGCPERRQLHRLRPA